MKGWTTRSRNVRRDEGRVEDSAAPVAAARAAPLSRPRADSAETSYLARARARTQMFLSPRLPADASRAWQFRPRRPRHELRPADVFVALRGRGGRRGPPRAPSSSSPRLRMARSSVGSPTPRPRPPPRSFASPRARARANSSCPSPTGTAARALSSSAPRASPSSTSSTPTLRERARTCARSEAPTSRREPPPPPPPTTPPPPPIPRQPRAPLLECVSTLGADPLRVRGDEALRARRRRRDFRQGRRRRTRRRPARRPPASRPSFVPDARAALASIADTSRFIAGLSVPGDGAIGGYGPSPRRRVPGDEDGVGGGVGVGARRRARAGAPPSDLLEMLKSASAARDATRASGDAHAKRHPNLRFLPASGRSPDGDARHRVDIAPRTTVGGDGASRRARRDGRDGTNRGAIRRDGRPGRRRRARRARRAESGRVHRR